MTTKIRKNVFETNSSSSHSLTLSQSDVLPMPFTKEQLREGVVMVGLGDYNWEWARYYTTEEKLQYLLTQLIVGTDDTIAQGDAVKVTQELCEEDERAAMLVAVVKEHTGCDLLFKPGSRGGIDHQSIGVGLNLFESAEKLKQFLFSPTSCVQTGNDNTSAPKIIETEQGYEDYYAKNYCEPGADWVQVDFVVKSSLWSPELETSNGAIISDESNEELLAIVKAQATVVSADWVTVGPWEHLPGYEEHVDYVMNQLAEAGLRFSENLTVSEAFTKVPLPPESKVYRSTEVVTLKTYMPKALADTLAKLPPQPMPNASA